MKRFQLMTNSIQDTLIQGISHGVVGILSDYTIFLWSSWMEKHSGIKADSIIGKNIFEMFPAIKNRNKADYLISCIEKKLPGILSPLMHQYLIPLEITRHKEQIPMLQEAKLFPVQIDEGISGALILIKNYTESILHEDEINHLTQLLNAHRKIIQMLVRAKSEDEIYQKVSNILISETNAHFAWIEFKDQKTGKITPAAHADNHFKSFKELAIEIKLNQNIIGVLHILHSEMHQINPDMLSLYRELADDISFAINAIRIEEQKKQVEKALVKAKNDAESANQAKSNFLANMSHEIRTPMNSMIGFSQILKDQYIGPLNKKQLKYVENIIESANQLLFLINDILDISKVEAGKLEIDRNPYSLYQLMERVKQTLTGLTAKKSIESYLQIAPDIPKYLIGDNFRIEQVLRNLISNAVKFTEHGKIEVSVEKESSDKLIFKVKDSGIGIPENKKAGLFSKFYQADSSCTKKYAGTGLGLSIAKELVELMGGDIGFESELGKGSLFYFTLKIEVPEGEIIVQEQKNLITQLRESVTVNHEEMNIPIDLKILVAEDNIFNQEVIEGLLHNHKVTFAKDGKETIEILENKSFDLILMDIQMPEMDGITAFKLIRDKNSKVINHDIPIIAMTAYSMKEDRDLFLNSGMNGYVSKPVTHKSLKNEIYRVLKLEDELKSNSQISHVQQIHFNQNTFMDLLNNDSELALKLIDSFINNTYPKNIVEIKNAIEKKDANNLKGVAHKFKGSISYFSEAGGKLTFQLQEMGQKEDFSKAHEVYEELKKEVEALIPELRDFMAKKII